MRMLHRQAKIILIHGFLAKDHMQRHLCTFIKSLGYEDVKVYGHIHPIKALAQIVEIAVGQQCPVIIIGYSQGGFHAMKLAQYLQKQNIELDLLVTIAAGGMGRLLPTQWGYNPRKLPANVRRYLNFFAEGDRLGSDLRLNSNVVEVKRQNQFVENIIFDQQDHVSHIEIVRCYPAEKVHPKVKELLLDRLVIELQHLQQL